MADVPRVGCFPISPVSRSVRAAINRSVLGARRQSRNLLRRRTGHSFLNSGLRQECYALDQWDSIKVWSRGSHVRWRRSLQMQKPGPTALLTQRICGAVQLQVRYCTLELLRQTSALSLKELTQKASLGARGKAGMCSGGSTCKESIQTLHKLRCWTTWRG